MPWDRRTFRAIQGSRPRKRPRWPRLPLGLLALVGVIGAIVLLEQSDGWRGLFEWGGSRAAACERGMLTGAVTHVRDGDTIEVARVPIRLSGIAAPEWDEPGGSEATAAMQNFVAGRTLRCELDGARTYDRCAGVCFLNGADVGAEMVRRGLARDCPRYSGGSYAAAEQEAAGRGATIGRTYPLPGYCRARR